MRSVLWLVLTAPALALTLPRYDPDADRFAFKTAGSAAYTAAEGAYRAPLAPERVADIRAGLDEAVRQAGLAADAARRLDGAAQGRAADMKGAVKESAADSPAVPAPARARWKKLSEERRSLGRRVEGLPDRSPDGSPNSDKAAAKEDLSKAADALKDADAALTALEGAAKDAAAAADAMKSAADRATFDFPYGELLQADAEGLDMAGRLPGTADEAKALAGLLDQEPRERSRKNAADKLDEAREQARRLFDAADKASNRADAFRLEGLEFDAASAAWTKAAKAAADRPARAEAALDEAERRLEAARGRLP